MAGPKQEHSVCAYAAGVSTGVTHSEVADAIGHRTRADSETRGADHAGWRCPSVGGSPAPLRSCTFEELRAWLEKVTCVQLQSYIDAMYAVYRRDAPVARVPEAGARAEWCKAAYDKHRRDYDARFGGPDALWSIICDLANDPSKPTDTGACRRDLVFAAVRGSGEMFLDHLEKAWQDAEALLPAFVCGDPTKLRNAWLDSQFEALVASYVTQGLAIEIVSPNAAMLTDPVPLVFDLGDGHQLPKSWSEMLQADGSFLRARTLGDGACALHAVFGTLSSGFLHCDEARKRAAAVLRRELATHRKPEEDCTHLASVRETLWAELALPAARHASSRTCDVSPEAVCFWSYLQPSVREYVLELVDAQEDCELQHRTYMIRLNDACRTLFTAAKEPSCRVLAVALGHLPHGCSKEEAFGRVEIGNDDACQEPSPFLTSPYVWNEDRRVNEVRGSRAVVSSEMLERCATKYAALFREEHCYDAIRQSFVLPTGVAGAHIADLVESVAQEVGGIEEVSDLISLLRDRPSPFEVPAEFAHRVSQGYCSAVEHEADYYISVCELLALATAVGSSVVVAKLERGKLVPLGHTRSSCPPYAVVLLQSVSGTAVRSHFERLVPFNALDRGAFGLACAMEEERTPVHETLAIWKFVTEKLCEQELATNELVELGSAISSACIGDANGFAKYVAHQWQGVFVGLPRFLVSDARTLEAKWFANVWLTLLHGYFATVGEGEPKRRRAPQ